ncbi:hypothetical protein G6F70_006546 [Rhizopus microsporus]|uniref:Ubiquitin-conjugating enzyme E2 W n=1 Tax=Rhizopus azygosporus TaxID=86630 RepID=A0A367K5J1_RHIAZ|nr:hypothetical protein G6F71_006489 [Rhizopus microsporus]RCH97440.1 ubiquitin-conjugating enzyme E2 W [Rhizopus azygosporus]KAG1197529.1 hypothetical protein G6F70_006546 [Rhizopus microsporus]KAG1209297.1 hypothetical protein G6F69_006485 [Rhizopus microsporus]KAG1230704.1 hypothetical protein G6F67_006274 [Rhizopus microsporus]
MTSLYSKRLTKELRDLQKNPPEGVEVEEASNFLKWTLCLTGARGSVYEGEKFKLEFRFTPQYPLEAPEVVFIRPYVPIHPHVNRRILNMNTTTDETEYIRALDL